jgi:catechol 2,3-dioxygenase-like lactoylglutathione lyase family enzyme
MALDHVALTVSDREQSAAFYGEHFGLSACTTTADPTQDRPRVLIEEVNPEHRRRVEHDRATLLVHLYPDA